MQSSKLIQDAIAATRWKWPDIPEIGMITFVDKRKVKGPNFGYCYKMAGFRSCGKTKGGLIALRLAPEDWPSAKTPRGVLL